MKTVPLKANQLDALLPIVVDVEEEPARADGTAIGAVVRANVFVRMNVVEIASRLDKLRKDPHAVTAIMEIWNQSEELHQQLAVGGNGKSAMETELLIARLHAKHLVAQVHAALAKTEESPASARVASRNGRQRAKQLAESAVVLGPDLPETHLAMGDMAIDSDQPLVAEAEYRHALLLNPASSTAHIKLADALRLKGNLPEAIAELREALRIDPSSASAHNDLGYLLGTQQNTSESTSEYREALRLDPDFIEAHNYLAIVHARAGQIPDAVAEFREIVRIDPDSVLGYYNHENPN